MRSLVTTLLLSVALATSAAAESSFQFTVAGSQAPVDANVNGFRIVTLQGANQSVSGFDLGLISLSESVNSSGVSMIWGIGKVTGKSSGLASAFFNVHSGEDSGVNAAFINSIRTMRSGANVGFINVTQGASNVDISGMSISAESKVQLGFINVTSKITGVQIGFLNFAENGFLPVFPFFNFPKN